MTIISEGRGNFHLIKDRKCGGECGRKSRFRRGMTGEQSNVMCEYMQYCNVLSLERRNEDKFTGGLEAFLILYISSHLEVLSMN